MLNQRFKKKLTIDKLRCKQKPLYRYNRCMGSLSVNAFMLQDWFCRKLNAQQCICVRRGDRVVHEVGMAMITSKLSYISVTREGDSSDLPGGETLNFNNFDGGSARKEKKSMNSSNSRE